MTIDPVLRILIDVANAAAELIRRDSARGFEVFYKGPNDPVTTVDHAANEQICAALSSRFPDLPIVAEESDPATYTGFVDAPRSLFVDPIDGTREFIGGSDEYVVMIGLAELGVAKLGVVVAPRKGVSWFADVGSGAFREEAGVVTPIRVSSVATLRDATLLAPHPNDEGRLETALSALSVGKVQSVGSAGLKGAWVAEGRGDVYLSPGRSGKRWDACAIDALLQAAGGTLTDTTGARLDYRRPNLDNEAGLLATNGSLLPQVLEAFAARELTR
jgi:3'(2'), 5'-bisphosphate nucleotidase